MEREIDKSCAVTRPRNPLDDVLGFAYPVLDHGFVRAVDFMGDDQAIVDAASFSYGKGINTPSSNQALINYLMGHWHTTPFEMCEIKFHIKMPIFVMRQWIRHRTANVNEYSARYSILDAEFYIPEPEMLAKQSQTNNQGRGEVLDPEKAAEVISLLKASCAANYDDYELMHSDDESGGYDLARELARMNLPTNIYTQCYWKIDLHNLFHFLRLRMDSHAQYEIRVYANQIADLVAMWVPQAFKAFVDYRLGGEQFSMKEMKALQDLLKMYINLDYIEPPEFAVFTDDYGLSKREATEFIKKVGFKI